MKRMLSAAVVLLVLAGCTGSRANNTANHRFSFEGPYRGEPVLEARAHVRQNKSLRNSGRAPRRESAKNESSNEVIRIRKNYCSVRPAPGALEKHVAVLRGGTKVEKMEGKGNWVRIRFDDKGLKKEGWIHKDSLQASIKETGQKRKKPKKEEPKIDLSPL